MNVIKTPVLVGHGSAVMHEPVTGELVRSRTDHERHQNTSISRTWFNWMHEPVTGELVRSRTDQ